MFDKKTMVSPDQALSGRDQSIALPAVHYVNENPFYSAEDQLNVPEGYEQAMFGMGCFWGAERKFWTLPGVYLTAVGYAAGYTKNPSYEEVCTGATGHNEVVWLVYNPQQISYVAILKTFWESHNPTQGMRQGNDSGTQYRSGIYYYNVGQQEEASRSSKTYQAALKQKGFDAITTEVIEAPQCYFAEQYHQQYLAKNPNGYCGLGGTGVGME